MNKEGITIVAQLLSAMKDAVSELEYAQKKKDLEKIKKAKQEILSLKQQIDQSI